jgi:hypothetical protein
MDALLESPAVLGDERLEDADDHAALILGRDRGCYPT